MQKSDKEISVEQHLFDGVKARGGFCIKMTPGREVPRGFPDRLVGLPGFIGLVEMKRPKNGRFSPAQIRWKDLCDKFGISWHTFKTTQEVDGFLAQWPIKNRGS